MTENNSTSGTQPTHVDAIHIITVSCADCGIKKDTKPMKTGGPRLPTGWKRRGNDCFCPACWRKLYVLRALIVPVAQPLSGSWDDLRADLKAVWTETTAASNWMITELYTRDIRRNGQPKMPPMPRVYLYPEARIKFPALPANSIASLEQATQKTYRSKRYDIVWAGSASLPSMRYPQPFPVANQAWSLSFNGANQPVISARIANQRWELRLKGGARYWRQTACLKKITSNAAIPGEAVFYRVTDGTIMCKMVAWLPREARSATMSGTLFVRTCIDKLLVAVDAKDQRVWTYNADHLRRWIAEYNRKRQRLAEDQKAEQRPVPSFAARRDAMTQKQHHRVRSAVQEIAASVALFAARRKIAVVHYDDSEHGFAGDGFPYFELKDRIKVKLDELGIELKETARAKTEQSTPEALSDDEAA